MSAKKYFLLYQIIEINAISVNRACFDICGTVLVLYMKWNHLSLIESPISL
jgi:hypothetical protein